MSFFFFVVFCFCSFFLFLSSYPLSVLPSLLPSFSPSLPPFFRSCVRLRIYFLCIPGPVYLTKYLTIRGYVIQSECTTHFEKSYVLHFCNFIRPLFSDLYFITVTHTLSPSVTICLRSDCHCHRRSPSP